MEKRYGNKIIIITYAPIKVKCKDDDDDNMMLMMTTTTSIMMIVVWFQSFDLLSLQLPVN